MELKQQQLKYHHHRYYLLCLLHSECSHIIPCVCNGGSSPLVFVSAPSTKQQRLDVTKTIKSLFQPRFQLIFSRKPFQMAQFMLRENNQSYFLRRKFLLKLSVNRTLCRGGVRFINVLYKEFLGFGTTFILAPLFLLQFVALQIL